MATGTQLNFAKLGSTLLLILAVAVPLNVVLFLVGKAAGLFPESVIIPNANQPLTLTPVVVATMVPSVIATLVFALLIRFSAKGDTIFKWISIVLLVLSFYNPFTIPNVPLAMALLLNLMHVVVAGAIIYFFTIKNRRESFLNYVK